MYHLKIMVSSLCLRQWLILYWHVVVTLENAMKLASITFYPISDYIKIWILIHCRLVIQLESKFGCFVNMKFINVPEYFPFLSVDVVDIILSINEKW
jgi:hypothetical protein